MAVDDERGVATCHQRLVEESIDVRHGLVGALTAHVDRRIDRTRRRATTSGHAVDEHDRRSLRLLGARLFLRLVAIALGPACGAMRIEEHLADRHRRTHEAEANLDLAVTRWCSHLAAT